MEEKKKNIFYEVNNLKDKVIEEVMKNQKLLKLVSIKNNNPLSEPDIIGAGKLIDDCIWFKPKVFSTTIQETQCFLLTDVMVYSIRDYREFADIKLIFRILVHNTLFELYDGKTRAYEIAGELMDMFDKETGGWLGECRLENGIPIESPADYQAIQLTFSVTDFKK